MPDILDFLVSENHHDTNLLQFLKVGFFYPGLLPEKKIEKIVISTTQIHSDQETKIASGKPEPQITKKRETITLVSEQEQVKRDTIDPAYQILIDQGAVSAPVKVNINSPVGTVFTSRGQILETANSNPAALSNTAGNSEDSTSIGGIPVGKPGQTMADVIQEQRARLKEDARNYFATAEEEKRKLAQRAAIIGAPLRFEREDGNSDVLVGITESNDPLYISNNNISGADTIGVDQLWPTGTVGVWNDPGNTGLNLTGAGEILGMWEAAGSVRVSQEQFGGRVVQLDFSPSGEDNHATAVAGTLASAGIPSFFAGSVNVGTWSRGVAFDSSVNAYDITDFSGELANEAGSGLKFSNNSYGLTTGWVNSGTAGAPIWRWFGPAAASAIEDWRFGAYTSLGASITSRGLDDAANSAPNTALIYSAGNDQGEGPGAAITNYFLANTATTSSLPRDWTDGDDGGYDTMNTLGSAKNVLTVGSIQTLEGGWLSAGAVVQSPFSTTGPTDDGRIKPEVVAQGSRTSTITPRNPNGFQIVTTGFSPTAPDDATYSLQAGTSFAAPSVTGVLALVNERRTLSRSSFSDLSPPGSVVVIDQDWSDHPLRASGMRALMAHTADEAGANPGPDYRFGYGVVNAARAVQLISLDSGSGGSPGFGGPKPYYKEVLLGAATSIRFKAQRIDASTPVKVTAAWSDPAGAGQTTNAIDQQNARLVNDLDVRIYPPGVVPGPSTKNAATTAKPWILNPDLTNKSAVTRGAAATTGDDSRNNLEQVQINSPVTGDYTVVIDHKGFSLNGGSQWVSLAISGVLVPTPPSLTSTVTNTGGGTFSVAWPSLVGAGYVVEGTPDLNFWTPSTGEISAGMENSAVTVTPPSGATSYFWRVVRVY